MDEPTSKTVLEVLDEGTREVLSEVPPVGVEKFQMVFERVMNKVRSAYQEEKIQQGFTMSTSVETVMKNKKGTIMDDRDSGSADESETLKSMEKEIEVARRLLEVSQLREEQSRQTIAKLEADVAALRKMVEEEETIQKEEGLNLQQLLALKKKLVAENENLSAEIQSLNSQYLLTQTELQEVTNDKKRMDNRLNQLKLEFRTREEELTGEIMKSRKLEENVEKLQQDLLAREDELKEISQNFEMYAEENKELEERALQLEEINDELRSNLSVIVTRYEQTVREYELLKEHLNSMNEENCRLMDHLKVVDKQIAEQQHDLSELEKIKSLAQSRVDFYEKDNRRADEERLKLESQLGILETELQNLKKGATLDKAATEKLAKENAHLLKTVKELAACRDKQAQVWAVQQEAIRNLENELSEAAKVTAKQKALVLELEQDKARLERDVDSLRKEKADWESKLKCREREAANLQLLVNSLEKNVQRQNHSEESLKSNRGLVNAELSELKEQNHELERRLKTLFFTVEQLKEEVSATETALVHERHEKQKMERNIELLRKGIEDKRKDDQNLKSNLQHVEKENHKLNTIFRHNKNEAVHIQNQLEQVKSERTHLLGKLSTYKSRLENLTISCKDLEKSSLDKDAVIKKLNSEMTLIKSECDNLRLEKEGVIRKLNRLRTIEKEYHLLRETFLHEQSRSAALDFDKRVAVRVHPWRILQVTDPAAYMGIMRSNSSKRQRGSTTSRNRISEKLPPVGGDKEKVTKDLVPKSADGALQRALIQSVL